MCEKQSLVLWRLRRGSGKLRLRLCSRQNYQEKGSRSVCWRREKLQMAGGDVWRGEACLQREKSLRRVEGQE